VSAYILSALPLLLFAVIQMSNPDYVGELTGTPTGRMLLGYAAASLAIGVLMMQKMAKVEQ
jgi:Flp pilus assembly protein TadB